MPPITSGISADITHIGALFDKKNPVEHLIINGKLMRNTGWGDKHATHVLDGSNMNVTEL